VMRGEDKENRALRPRATAAGGKRTNLGVAGYFRVWPNCLAICVDEVGS